VHVCMRVCVRVCVHTWSRASASVCCVLFAPQPCLSSSRWHDVSWLLCIIAFVTMKTTLRVGQKRVHMSCMTICVYDYVYKNACIHTYTCTHTHARTHARLHKQKHTNACTHIHTYIHAHTHFPVLLLFTGNVSSLDPLERMALAATVHAPLLAATLAHLQRALLTGVCV